MPLKVAVNCWVLRNKNLDGIGYFTINTVSRIIENNPSVQFLILCDKNFTENYFDFPNAVKYPIFPPLRHPVLYVLYMEVVVTLFLKKHNPDILLSPDGFLSLSTSKKQLPVIHDINFVHHPEGMKIQNRLYYNFFFKRFIKKATRIATISQYSKQDIVTFYNADGNMVDVVYCAANINFHPLSQQEIENTRNSISDGHPYFLFVGSMHPRKNIKRLIEAFTLFKKRTQSTYKLILAGSILWRKSEIEGVYLSNEYKNDIIFTGRVPDDELQKITASAFALSFVPIFEGFGMPIIEAMQCNVPVICSNITSMPEVAGNAAILVDPFNIAEIASAMEKLYLSDPQRQTLISLGAEQHKHFSWDKTATLLWESILHTLEQLQY
ncbi:MAG TPA: glycosyltransferase family 1 protein [Chitinophagaceae bacterium]|nr:glycosyltransferase family 1 protein [Chitinophagaceae bacterium]